MRILLIYSCNEEIARFKNKRTEFPPMGLLYLAAAINTNEHEIDIAELHEIRHGYSDIFYDIIGLGINTAYCYDYFLEKIQIIAVLGKALIAGGQFATLEFSKVIQELGVKAVIRGEGEEVVNRVIKSIDRVELNNIDGVVTKDNMKLPSKILRIEELDRLSQPARDLLPDGKILLNHRVAHSSSLSISMITSRGCPFSCAFCGNLYKNIFLRSPVDIRNETEQLIERYSINHITLLDENILYNDEHLFSICNIFNELNIKWTCNARVDFYTDKKIRAMSKSGCVEIKFGVESGDKRMLRMMNKKITIEDTYKAITGSSENGISTKAFLIFGFPSESSESIDNTIALLDNLKHYLNRVNLFNFIPVYNSDCYVNPDKYDIMLGNSPNKYSFYADFQHWWGAKDEYFALLKKREDIALFICDNFSTNEPITINGHKELWTKKYLPLIEGCSKSASV